MSGSTQTRIPRTRLLALVVLCAATLMTIVDETVVSVALPEHPARSRLRDLRPLVGRERLPGVVRRPAAAVRADRRSRRPPPRAARRADALRRRLGAVRRRTGRRRGSSPRGSLQGAGGALAASVALGMVVSLFDDPGLQARAIGIYSFVGAAGASIGLFLGGVITDLVDWRWVFFINIPIGIATVLVGSRVLAVERGPGLREGADAAGAVLLVAGLMLAIVAIVDADARALGVVAAVLLVLFVRRQATARRPLLPLRHPALAHRRRGERRPRAHRRRDVRLPVPRDAVLPAGPRLLAGAGGARRPAGRDGDRRDVARRVPADRAPARRAGGAAAGPPGDRRRARAAGARAGRRSLPRRRGTERRAVRGRRRARAPRRS